MGMLLFGSAKGSPGVTTTVLALAARWPQHREPFVFEADPTGGDIVVRLASLQGDTDGLRETPSTVQLAAATRHGLTDLSLLEHAQRLPGVGEVRAVVSPASAFAAATALGELGTTDLAAHLASSTKYDTLVDVGTISSTSPMLAAVRRAKHAVLVTRPTLESILHARELVATLSASGVRCELIVIGDRPYSPIDVAQGVGAEVVGLLPFDPVGASALAGEARSPKVLGRSRLVHAAAQLAGEMAGRLPATGASLQGIVA